jgi:threonine aldolase
VIELRSDTFTLPTPTMREAMRTAEVGNDAYGEDPTVRRLEELAATTLGKAAALFMPSGTMANLTAIMAHVPRGGRVICGDESDIYLHEAGGAAVCAGAVYTPVPTRPDGRLRIDDLVTAFPEDPADPEFAPAALICLENSHNRTGGRVLPMDYLAAVRELGLRRRVPVHLDGARLFNAATRLGVPVADIAGYADSVQFCLSKGLGAPFGSMVAGDRAFIDRCRRIRKMLGGALRQSGIMAAAGIVALTGMSRRLVVDHEHAYRLATGLAALPGVLVEPGTVETNIVFFRVAGRPPEEFVAAVRERGLAVGVLGHGRIRAVTHAGVGAADIDRALAIVADVLGCPAPVAARARAQS